MASRKMRRSSMCGTLRASMEEVTDGLDGGLAPKSLRSHTRPSFTVTG